MLPRVKGSLVALRYQLHDKIRIVCLYVYLIFCFMLDAVYKFGKNSPLSSAFCARTVGGLREVYEKTCHAASD